MNTATTSAPVAFNVRKGRDGYEAKTEFPLSNGDILGITTSKSSSGIGSHASVWRLEDGCKSYMPYDDFSKPMGTSKVRCTEKSVREKHAAALLTVDALKIEVAAFYAAKAEEESPA